MFRLKTSAGKTTWAHWKDQTSHVRSHHEGIPMNSHPDAYFNALFGQLEIQITALVSLFDDVDVIHQFLWVSPLTKDTRLDVPNFLGWLISMRAVLTYLDS